MPKRRMPHPHSLKYGMRQVRRRTEPPFGTSERPPSSTSGYEEKVAHPPEFLVSVVQDILWCPPAERDRRTQSDLPPWRMVTAMSAI